MKKWFLKINHIPISKGVDEGPGIAWAHGKGDALPIPMDELSVDWLMKYGFKTKAVALRALRARGNAGDSFWREEATIDSRDVPDVGLHYKIYRCYEIVILDENGNQVGESDYCYGDRKFAEETARYDLKMREEER